MQYFYAKQDLASFSSTNRNNLLWLLAITILSKSSLHTQMHSPWEKYQIEQVRMGLIFWFIRLYSAWWNTRKIEIKKTLEITNLVCGYNKCSYNKIIKFEELKEHIHLLYDKFYSEIYTEWHISISTYWKLYNRECTPVLCYIRWN